uniref:Uncharacterized protein n=1 Tax=Triticum urartu TaxID=4572 RepID=A0A8R7THW1_TRIUA
MLNCYTRRTHCSNRSCIIGGPTLGLPLRGCFHLPLISSDGAPATSEILVLSDMGLLVLPWPKGVVPEMQRFSCNVVFSLPVETLEILFVLQFSADFTFVLMATKPSAAAVSSVFLCSSLRLLRLISSLGKLSSVTAEPIPLELAGSMWCLMPVISVSATS